MSWFDDFSAKAEKALQATVAKVDAALDIKEEPGTILAPTAGKTKQELLEENRSSAAVDAVQVKLTTAALQKKRESTDLKAPPANGNEADGADDFFGMFGAAAGPTTVTHRGGAPPGAEVEAGSKKPASSKSRRSIGKGKGGAASKRRSSGKATANQAGQQTGGVNGTPQGTEVQAADGAAPLPEDAAAAAAPTADAALDEGGGKDRALAAEADSPLQAGAAAAAEQEKEGDAANTVVQAEAEGVPAGGEAPRTATADDDASTAGTTTDTQEEDTQETPPSPAGPDDAKNAKNEPAPAEAGAAADEAPPAAGDVVASPAEAAQADAPLEPITVPPGPTEEEIAGLDSVAASYAEKLAKVSVQLAAREEQLVTLNGHLAGKNETHSVLLSQIAQLESQLEDDFTGKLEELTAEFTGRLGDTEARLKEAARERDGLREQLETATARFSERIGQTDKLSGEVLAEKDGKIDGLMAEGQKLQKKLHESGLRNKKLQAKVKEEQSAAATLNTRIEAAQERIAALEKELATKAAKEEKYKATANQVSAVQDQQSKELTKAKKDVGALTKKNDSLQAALDTAFKAKADLEKKLAEETVKATSAVTAAESAAKASKTAELKTKEEEFEKVKKDLHTDILDLRSTVTRLQTQADRREANLQQEIADLNERLRHAEQREQQMTESMAQTTKPLVRQIDMLRATLADQTANSEVAEAGLVARLEEQSVALRAAEERERQAAEKLSEERVRTAGSDEKLASLRKAKIDLQAKVAKQMERTDEVELELHKAQQELKALVDTMEGAREEWRVEKLRLKALSADTLKTREDEWARERDALKRQMKDEAVARSGPARGSTPRLPPPTSLTESSTPARHESVASTGTPAGAIERLNGQVLQKDESLLAARRQLDELTKSRAAIADELVALVAKNEELAKQCSELPKVRSTLKETERKLDAVMVMYGEKKEEASELRLDLQDFRSLYQTQTQHLCGQIEALTAQVEEARRNREAAA